MAAEMLTIGGLTIEIIRKPIKNLHLSVCPPDGHIKISVPESLSTEAVTAAVVTRLDWIKKSQNFFDKAERQSPREMVSGESHYFNGKRYLLRVQNRRGPTKISIVGSTTLLIEADSRSSRDSRLAALSYFYRQHLEKTIPELIEKWCSILNIAPPTWKIRQMKTRWGTANIDKNQIVLNLELAKKPKRSVEYVVVHELMHFIDRTHSQKFKTLMDKNLPNWRERQAELNSGQNLWCGTTPTPG